MSGALGVRSWGTQPRKWGCSPDSPRTAQLKAHCLLPAQPGGTNHPQVLLTSLPRAHRGGNCESLLLFTELSFPCKTPRAEGWGHLCRAISCSATLAQLRQCQNRDFTPRGRLSTAEISSSVPGTCGSVPVALVPPLLVLAPSPRCSGWCQSCFPPSLRIWGLMGHIHEGLGSPGLCWP